MKTPHVVGTVDKSGGGPSQSMSQTDEYLSGQRR